MDSPLHILAQLESEAAGFQGGLPDMLDLPSAGGAEGILLA